MFSYLSTLDTSTTVEDDEEEGRMVSTMRCAFCVCGLVMLVATAAVDVAAQNAASTERSWSFGGGMS